MKYVDSRVWVVSNGIVGFDLDEINRHIDIYNREYYRYTDFWTYLSEEVGFGCYGFSALWHSKLMSKVHTIRREEY